MNVFLVVLSRVEAAFLVMLGLTTLVSWVRYRGRTRGLMAAALASLALATMVSHLASLIGAHPVWLNAIIVGLFSGSGFALLAVRDSLMPLARRTVRLVVVVAAVELVLTAAAMLTARPGAQSALQHADTFLLIGAWSACVGEPAIRFWFSARDLPIVQRRRLRAMSAGYLGIVAVLVVQTATGFRSLPVQVGAQLLGLTVVPLLYASFAPPRWLRRWWRQPEELAFDRATTDFLLFARDRTTLADRAMEWAMRLMGAVGGAMTVDGEVVAISGTVAAADLDRLTGKAAAATDPGTRTMVVPLGGPDGDSSLVVVGGALTPFFGSDEMERLRHYGVYIAAALERVRLVEALETQVRRNDFILDAASELGEGLVVTDAGHISYANDAYLKITGYSFEELEQFGSLVELVVPEERDEVVMRLRERLSNREVSTHYEATMLAKGNRRVVTENAVRLMTEEGPNRIVAVVRDITSRRRAEMLLESAVTIDTVTGIANRRAWDAELERAMARAERDGQPLCVAMLDIDHFKEYNDDWGHQRGDQLLAEVAESWARSLRAVDYLARLGGDEFAVLMAGTAIEEAEPVLDRLRANTAAEISIGIAAWDRLENADSLVGRADAALLEAKKGGRGRTAVAGPAVPGDGFTSLAQRLRRIFTERDLCAAYQPIVRLGNRERVGYEALARPAGEDAGASVEMLFQGARRLGCSRDLDWLSRRAALQGGRSIATGELLFVNVGVRALLDPLHGVDQMLMLLRWVGRDPGEVVLEISERDPITDFPRLAEVLAAYRAERFRFALDDVGEGHSTLEVMAAANAEYIKIARSLTVNAARPGARAAIQALVTFARTSGATLIAEGIEDDDTANAMLAMGVDLGQGYAFGRPAWLVSPGTHSTQLEVAVSRFGVG